MALRCPECSADNPLGMFFCGRCGSPLFPAGMMPPKSQSAPTGSPPTAVVPMLPASAPVSEPPSLSRSLGRSFEATFEDTARRYRIIMGDTCPICRAASRITFTRDRPPALPAVGCREKGGCRCALPDFDEEQEAVAAIETVPVADTAEVILPKIEEGPILDVNLDDEVVTSDEQDARVFGALCDH